MYPLVSELAADGIPVAVSCRVLGLARQPYYRWLDTPIVDSQLDEAYLANAVFDAHRDDPEFGYRFLADEVRQSEDLGLLLRGVHPRSSTPCRQPRGSHPRVRRLLMHPGGLCRRPDRASTIEQIEEPLLRLRAVLRTRHRQSLRSSVATTAGIQAREGKLYLCAIKDVFSNRIVGWSIDSRMKARLVVAAIEMAVARRDGDVAGCILHSDRGSQFRARKVQRTLTRHQMVGSMGQVGSAGDNAAMESFFALLQKNVLDRQSWATRDELRIEIVTWIERTYHRRRRQARLGRLTPIDYEIIMTPQTATAA
jgi:putative transposase